MTDECTTEGNESAGSPHLTLTVRQFADRMQVSMPTAYAVTEQEGFPVIRIGKKKLILQAALERWLEEQIDGDAPRQKARERWERA